MREMACAAQRTVSWMCRDCPGVNFANCALVLPLIDGRFSSWSFSLKKLNGSLIERSAQRAAREDGCHVAKFHEWTEKAFSSIKRA